MRKTLIVYYSRKGEDYWNGSIRDLAKGNTETVAEIIAQGGAFLGHQVETLEAEIAAWAKSAV